MTRENKTSRSCSPNLQEILAQLWQQAVCIPICHTTDSAQSKLFASHSMKVIAICIRGYLLFGPKRNCASHRAQLPSRALMCAETFFHNKEGKGTVLWHLSSSWSRQRPSLSFFFRSSAICRLAPRRVWVQPPESTKHLTKAAPSSLSQGHKRPHRRKDPRTLSLPFVWSIGFLCFCSWAESSPATLG